MTLMFRYRLAVLLFALLVWIGHAPAAARYMPIDEVKPGMEGIGRTVFQGTTIEDFKVRVLGVLRNTAAPKRDLILARIDGGPLAKTGVIAGMSGSPVYIDGRLVGAVSYSLGQFATEAIAGITPIEEMISATDRVSEGAAPRTTVRWPAVAARLASGQFTLPGAGAAFADAAAHVSFAGPPGAYDVSSAVSLRPIALPLVTGGVDLGTMPGIAAAFEQAGFAIAPGGRTAAAQSAPPARQPGLRPGDAVGAALITGDLAFGATGTVTEVVGDRVYAFGHPFYNVGPAQFPMTHASVITVLPSLLSSLKLTSMGDVVGTIEQDRATAIAGTLGAGPRLIPVTMTIASAGGAPRRFAFGVAIDPFLSPLLVYTAVFNTISSHERDYGAATYALAGRIRIAGHAPVEFDEIFTGDQPAVPAASAVALPLGTVLNNDREPAAIDGIDLTIDATEKPRTATIERVWIDQSTVRRGRDVQVRILLRTWRGENILHSVSVPIPLNAERPLTLLVSDGPRLAQWDTRDGRPVLGPESLATVIRRLNEARHANRIYVRLVDRQDGAIVGNETLPNLPSSVAQVLGSDRAGGGGTATQNATVGAWEIRTPFLVSGQRTLIIAPADGPLRP